MNLGWEAWLWMGIESNLGDGSWFINILQRVYEEEVGSQQNQVLMVN